MKKLLILLLVVFNGLAATAQSPAYKDEAFTEYFRKTSGWVASDGTISVALPEGKSLWLMGDSHIDGLNAADTTLPCLFQVRNTILVQDNTQPAELVTILDNTQTGVNRTPVKIAVNDNRYFWPGHGYATGDTAVVFWQLYEGAEMSHTGNYASKIYTKNISDASAIKKLEKLPIPDEYEFGNAVVVDSARSYVYFYGMKQDWIIFRPYVARIPLGADVFTNWEFFDGSNWIADVNTSTQLMGTTSDYVSPSFSVIKLQDKYYMISQDIGFLTCGLGRDIYSWESENPEGPFTNKKLLYTIEDKYRGEYMITYNATAHPQFIRNNELLISYNVNRVCTNYCESPFTDRYNADLYRPKFIRVPLDYIDPELNVPDPVYPAEPPITSVGDAGEPGWRVFPNPSEGEVLVEVDGPPRQRTIEVVTSMGQSVNRFVTRQDKFTITIDQPGVYFLSLIDQDGPRQVRRIVVL